MRRLVPAVANQGPSSNTMAVVFVCVLLMTVTVLLKSHLCIVQYDPTIAAPVTLAGGEAAVDLPSGLFE